MSISTMFSNMSLNYVLFLFICLASIPSTLTLICYNCKDCTDVTCPCNNTDNTDTGSSYCILLRENLDIGTNVEIRSIPRNSTKYYIDDPYYISVNELISYDKTNEQWLSKSQKITYACQTDKCNQPDLLRQLPANGLSLTLPSDWLNENLRHKPDQYTTLCYDCPDKAICSDREYYLNTSECNVKKCSDFCAMGETFRQGQTTEFCYESFCVNGDLTPEIGITAIYYINNRQFQVIEIDMTCNGDDCSRLEIFKDIKEKLQKDYSGIQVFLPGNHANSIYSISSMIMIVILFQTFISY